jgi:hypothetical protein
MLKRSTVFAPNFRFKNKRFKRKKEIVKYETIAYQLFSGFKTSHKVNYFLSGKDGGVYSKDFCEFSGFLAEFSFVVLNPVLVVSRD